MPPTAGSPWVNGVRRCPDIAELCAIIFVPTHGILAPCSEPSRRGLASVPLAVSQQRRPALTAPARGAHIAMRVGTKKRPSDRTKKLPMSKESEKGRKTVLDNKSPIQGCAKSPREALQFGTASGAILRTLSAP